MQCASAPSRLTISLTRGRTTVKESSQIQLGMPFLSFERESVLESLVPAFDDANDGANGTNLIPKPSGDPSGLRHNPTGRRLSPIRNFTCALARVPEDEILRFYCPKIGVRQVQTADCRL